MMLEAALEYAARGWHVFPLKPRGKAPLTRDGFKSATTDVDQVQRWWAQWPDANIGIATGASGLFVVDVDVADGKPGLESLAALTARGLPPTETVRTGTGGQHLYFRGEGRSSAGKLAPGIDTRGRGGYVVAPPSVHPNGQRYQLEPGSREAIADAPAWLPAALEPPVRPSHRTYAPSGTEAGLSLFADALRHIQADDRETWLRVGMALHHETGGASDAFELWDDWSRKSSKYDVEDQANVWASFSSDGAAVTGGTIVSLARGGGWRDPRLAGGRRSNATAGRDGAGQPRQLGSGGSGTRPPVITVAPGDLHRAVDDAEHLLRGANVYQRDGRLVGIRRDPGPGGRSSSPVIYDQTADGLRVVLGELAEWERPRSDGKGNVPSDVPKDVAKSLVCRGEWQNIRPLWGIVGAPTLRPDGTVLQRPGYDGATCLLYMPPVGFTVPAVPDAPTDDEVRAALRSVRDVFCDFPFAGDAHEGAALAALMTVLVRPCIDGPTPMFIVDATTRGSGKGLLTDVVSLTATGRTAPIMPQTSDEEFEKRVTALLLRGATLGVIDNVARPLGGAAMDAMLTADIWSGRRLGASTITEIPNRITWIATGNNVALRGDMPRRCLRVYLVPDTERPEERTGFAHPDLAAWTLKNRGELVAAVLTIARGYIAAGRPEVPGAEFGSFGRWRTAVRDPLVWAGAPDPLTTISELREEADVELSAWCRVVDGIVEVAGEEPFGVGQVLEAMGAGAGNGRSDALQALAELCGTDSPTARQVAARLRSIKGRIISGRRLRYSPDPGKRGRSWTVETVKCGSPS